MDSKQLQEYRKKLYTDLFSNTIPDRIPVQDGLSIEFMIQYAGMDLMETQFTYTYDKVMAIYEKNMEILRGDIMVGLHGRNPISMMFQQSISNQMSATGFIQHPERSCMPPEDYDLFIQNPFDYVQENVTPKTNRAYAKGNVYYAKAYAKALLSTIDQNAIFTKGTDEIRDKYGLHAVPAGANAMGQPPFDYLADFLRGFSQITLDIKRRPDKVLEALSAAMPYSIRMSKPAVPNILGAMTIMTHMGVFLNNKDFEKFYFPTFNELCHINAERGVASHIFLEGDWTRFLDLLQELPMGTRLYMEYGDPQAFKDKLGKKHVLGGFYPLSLLRTGTKQECIDKAKELIDILAPGGNYFFCFDKSALDITDINPENYVAVLEYVRDNGKYSNAGEKVSTADKDSTIIKGLTKKYPEFKSKYVLSFEDFKKEYPPVNDKCAALMEAAYKKYAMIDFM